MNVLCSTHPNTYLVDYCMCSDQGSNLKPWHIKMTLCPTELPGQGSLADFYNRLPFVLMLAQVGSYYWKANGFLKQWCVGKCLTIGSDC